VQGIRVALWSYAFFVLLSIVGSYIYFFISEHGPTTRTAGDQLFEILFSVLWIALWGLVIVGWLMVSVGGIAGWLLLRLRQRFRPEDDTI
jgi:hypothetical protein